MIKIANAPCSWGVLEFEVEDGESGLRAGARRDRRSPAMSAPSWATGASCPRIPAVLRDELRAARARHGRRVRHDPAGRLAFVRRKPRARRGDGAAAGRRRRRHAARHRAVGRADGRSAPRAARRDASRPTWASRRVVGRGGGGHRADRRAPCATRPACARCSIITAPTFVETPQEIDALMQRTDPALVGLCLDSGHATYGGGSPLELLDAPPRRASGTCTSRTASRASPRARRQEEWDYQTALRHGLFCELGKGASISRRCCASSSAPATTAGSSSSRTSCRRWARRSRAPRATGSICGRLGYRRRRQPSA